jgi:ParB family chromosome partitioning protein
MANKKEHLGKGLGALLGFNDDYDGLLDEKAPKAAMSSAASAGKGGNPVQGVDAGIISIPVGQIDNNVNQPRKNFDENSIRELADSIREHGVIQPILVVAVGSRYMIVAGERRWRACKLAGLKEIPAVVKTFTNRQVAEIAIIENLQRDDLNDMELSRGIKRLMEEYNLTQEKVAERIGKTRSTVANMLRLNSLPAEVQKLLEQGKLSYGHAIRLLGVADVHKLTEYAKEAAVGELSVRALGDLIDGGRKMFNAGRSPNGNCLTINNFRYKQSPEVRDQEILLTRAIGTKVEITGDGKSGRVTLAYYSADELTRITNLLFNGVKNSKKV